MRFRRSMPSSFKGAYGRIVYVLEAKLTRSWKWDRNVEHKLNFASKNMVNLNSMAVCKAGGCSPVTVRACGGVCLRPPSEKLFHLN